MDISDKEILIDELDEHLRQEQDCIIGNPFIHLEHAKLWQLIRWNMYHGKHGAAVDDTDEIYQGGIFQELDKMMREIIDLR